MSGIRSELAQSAAGLEAVSNAAMASLGLVPNEFAWFTGKTEQPMAPQAVLSWSDVELSSITSRATYYGGRIANDIGNFACGHIQACIKEHIPEGAMHQSGRHTNPVPYISRLLTVNKGCITVETPTRNPLIGDGPVVLEGIGRSPRYRKTTVYNIESGDVTVKSGQLIIDGRGWKDDRTVEQDAYELPNDILLPRLATVIRTIKSTSSMFDQIAWRNVKDVSWEIQERAFKH